MVLQQIFECYSAVNLVPIIIRLCRSSLPFSKLDVPIGLLCRMTLSFKPCLEQFAGSFKPEQVAYFTDVLTHSNTRPITVCDLLSLLSHIARVTPENVKLVCDVTLRSSNSEPSILRCLSHDDITVRSKACCLVGNLIRKQNYALIQKTPAKYRADIFEALRSCLSIDEGASRRSASFAYGNIAYIGCGEKKNDSLSKDLGKHLEKAVPLLVNLLNDPVPKTRSNVTLTLGNLAEWGNSLRQALLKSQVIAGLLATVSHDSQLSVRQSALIALRSACAHADLKNALLSQKAVEMLTEFIFTLKSQSTALPTSARYTFSPRIMSARSKTSAAGFSAQSRQVMEHAQRLLAELKSAK